MNTLQFSEEQLNKLKSEQLVQTKHTGKKNKPTPKMPKPKKRLTAKQRQEQQEVYKMLKTVEAVKMVSLYVLRNQGWGETRLKRFNAKFNEYMLDVSHGYFSLSDIADIMKEECGLSLEELALPLPEGMSI